MLLEQHSTFNVDEIFLKQNKIPLLMGLSIFQLLILFSLNIFSENNTLDNKSSKDLNKYIYSIVILLGTSFFYYKLFKFKKINRYKKILSLMLSFVSILLIIQISYEFMTKNLKNIEEEENNLFVNFFVKLIQFLPASIVILYFFYHFKFFISIDLSFKKMMFYSYGILFGFFILFGIFWMISRQKHLKNDLKIIQNLLKTPIIDTWNNFTEAPKLHKIIVITSALESILKNYGFALCFPYFVLIVIIFVAYLTVKSLLKFLVKTEWKFIRYLTDYKKKIPFKKKFVFTQRFSSKQKIFIKFLLAFLTAKIVFLCLFIIEFEIFNIQDLFYSIFYPFLPIRELLKYSFSLLHLIFIFLEFICFTTVSLPLFYKLSKNPITIPSKRIIL